MRCQLRHEASIMVRRLGLEPRLTESQSVLLAIYSTRLTQSGGPGGNRNPNLLLARQMLSRLSYQPTKSPSSSVAVTHALSPRQRLSYSPTRVRAVLVGRLGVEPRLHVYKTCALTTELSPVTIWSVALELNQARPRLSGVRSQPASSRRIW